MDRISIVRRVDDAAEFKAVLQEALQSSSNVNVFVVYQNNVHADNIFNVGGTVTQDKPFDNRHYNGERVGR